VSKRLRIQDISKPSEQLTHVANEDLIPLPGPAGEPDAMPEIEPLSQEVKDRIEATLDDAAVLAIPKPATPEEEEDLVNKFLDGLRKLFSRTDNWTFLQPLVLSMEHCAKCQTCSEACHIYEASGKKEMYRPTYRSEILRRIYNKYIKRGGKFLGKWKHGDIDLNWRTIARLAELSYRCNLYRRCAQTCPIGLDNALITREIRKLLSQEMGIAPAELHEKGSMVHAEIATTRLYSSRVPTMEMARETVSILRGKLK